MKYLNYLAALICSVAPVSAQEPNSSPAPIKEEIETPKMEVGKIAVAQIRAKLASGAYESLFNQLDADYQQAAKEHGLEGLVEMRQEMAPPTAAERAEWQKGVSSLLSDRRQALEEVIAGNETTLFGQKVSSAVGQNSPEVQEALAVLQAIHFKAPGTGATPDENRLIDLDLEYEYKALHLDALVRGERRPPQELREKQVALQMQYWQKAAELASSFQDDKLKKAVVILSATADERLARGWDAADLQLLAKGRIEPETRLEEKAAAVVSAYQEKLKTLNLSQ
jgi:hypothetical protein